MVAVSGRGRPSGPEPRAMSRAPEPAPAAAGRLRPAPQPSRTGGRGSRENLSGAPRRVAGDSSEANHRLACVLRHHPAPTDQLREAGGGAAVCLWGFAVSTSCEGFGVSDPGATSVWPRTELTPWSPRLFCHRLCPHSRFTSPDARTLSSSCSIPSHTD